MAVRIVDVHMVRMLVFISNTADIAYEKEKYTLIEFCYLGIRKTAFPTTVQLLVIHKSTDTEL